MKKIFSGTVLFFLLCSTSITAKTYFCASEAITGVKHGNSITTKATIYSPKDKFLLRNLNGKWSLKKMGGGMPDMPCENAYYCGWHLGNKNAIPHNLFTRESSTQEFTFIYRMAHDDKNGQWTEAILQRGTCEAL
jgi:hypothetical protein